jgi:signal transduction histidine kinase
VSQVRTVNTGAERVRADAAIEIAAGVGAGSAAGTAPAGALAAAMGGGRGAMTPADLAELLGAFNDVTSRLEATHQELHAEVARLRRELSEANEALARSERLAALGQMAAGIAHEVRNPLASIGLYAALLAEDVRGRAREEELAGKIARAARGIEQVVTDVLRFARELKVRPEPTPARELLERALRASREETPALWAGVGVRWSPSRGDGPAAAVEPGLAQQALVNVIRNALEAMAECAASPAHTLTLGWRACAPVREGGPACVALVIEDTGPGIPPEALGRVFNPFFTTRAAGTGLGLSIVHRIADAHGGRAVVRARADGRGTTVELVFPRATEGMEADR